MFRALAARQAWTLHTGTACVLQWAGAAKVALPVLFGLYSGFSAVWILKAVGLGGGLPVGFRTMILMVFVCGYGFVAGLGARLLGVWRRR